MNPAPSPDRNVGGIALPAALQHKLEDFRSRLWSVKIAEGALAGIVGLGFSYLAVFAADRFVDTPAWARSLVLAAGAAVPALGLPLLWHRWVWRQQSLESVARLLRKRYPRFGDQLLGIVELAHREERKQRGQVKKFQGQSHSLVAAAMHQVDEQIRDRSFHEALPARHYGKWLAGAALALALAGIAFFAAGAAAENAFFRWATPWKAVERYTFARVAPLPGERVVPYAEPFELAARIDGKSRWRPDAATLLLPDRAKLSAGREEDAYRFEVPPQKFAGELVLRVGDAREEVTVRPLARPELSSLTATVRLPDYLLRREDPVVSVRGGSIPVLEGASVSFRGETTRELASARSRGEEVAVEGTAFSTPLEKVDYSRTRDFAWSDIHGLEAKAPLELRIEAVEDVAPTVSAKPVAREQVVIEDEVVVFDFSASDDYGLRRIGLEWSGLAPAGGRQVEKGGPGPEVDRGEKLVAEGGPERTELAVRGTFSAAREGVPPQTLQLRAYAEDFLPDRERSRSPVFVLHVLSEEEHAQWLTGEFAKWFRNARESYEREQQLHQENRSLRKLSPGELDQPGNRRRLEQQAGAETSNARRLGSLTESGRDLVRQAAKNEEFSAEKLETWAEKLRALEDIARERMPSVADLLRQASEAEGADGEASPAREKLDEALTEQKDLLAEFAKVADELREILGSLEASTFVKRLKAASRRQLELAKALNATLADGFGLAPEKLAQQLRETAGETAAAAAEESEILHHIQSDLGAYFQRKQDRIYKRVLDQMKETAVVNQVKRIGEEVERNFNGRSIAAAEYWSDTLDRWAEELVSAAQSQEADGEQEARDSLPPDLVLRVMKALRGEMELREETRELEFARSGLAPAEYRSRTAPLEEKQADLRGRIDGVVTDIAGLPDGARQFGQEIQLLMLVSDVMREARAVLARPDTGPEAIAAETEAIELLLQANRNKSSKGGGGGSKPGGSSHSGGAGSALSDIGIGPAGEEAHAQPSREVGQSTGKAGRELPEEFRRGLDAYFNRLGE